MGRKLICPYFLKNKGDNPNSHRKKMYLFENFAYTVQKKESRFSALFFSSARRPLFHQRHLSLCWKRILRWRREKKKHKLWPKSWDDPIRDWIYSWANGCKPKYYNKAPLSDLKRLLLFSSVVREHLIIKDTHTLLFNHHRFH